MNKNIIVISGPENSGKSTTVRMIVQQLKPFCDNRDNSDIKWPKHDFVNSTVPIRGAREILHELIINGKIVGLTSFGDSVEIIKEKFKKLDGEWPCDYIVCCCRDKGSTREYIERTYGGRILERFSLPQEKDFERRKQNEIDCAYKVDEKVLDLCGKGNCRFFNPHVGENYQLGVWGKKVLILGASFYCDKKHCDYFADCTNTTNKNSSKFDNICPEYADKLDNVGAPRKLSNEPSNVDDNYSAYKIFEKLFVGATGVTDMWSHVLFTNYVQFFVPPYETKGSYLSERDIDAFHKTLIQYNPDVVICWGTTIVKPIRENYHYVIDREKLPDTEHYIWHINPCGKVVTMVNPYHPVSNCWDCHYDKAKKYIQMALMEGMQMVDKNF